MHGAEQLDAVELIVEEVERKTEEELEKDPGLFLLHALPNLGLITDHDVLLIFVGIVSAITD